jgi:uncharacterized protein
MKAISIETSQATSRGLVPQRMAEALFRHMKGAALVVDIHASNIFLREIPQVRINQEFAERLVPLAREMNLDLIWVHGSLTVMEATISHSLNDVGTPCLVVEMGVGMRFTPAFTEQLVAGLLRVWQKLGVIAPEAVLPSVTHKPALADDDNVHYLNAETSGLFVPVVEHWTSLKKAIFSEQCVALSCHCPVRNPFAGRRPAFHVTGVPDRL